MYISSDLLPTTLEGFKIYRRYPLLATVRWLRASDESRITVFSFLKNLPLLPLLRQEELSPKRNAQHNRGKICLFILTQFDNNFSYVSRANRTSPIL